ncbi:MAG: O-antigen polymerase [Synechococcales bacterium]|nr:O-antigen polymerase [Synechococcales bacterium]
MAHSQGAIAPQSHPNALSQPHQSVFVAISPFQRGLILGSMVLYITWIGLQHLLHPVGIAAIGNIQLALLLNLSLLSVPFIWQPPGLGWFHPLVFVPLMMLSEHLQRTAVYVQGLQWHAALPGWSGEQLSQLVCEELLLRSLALLALYAGFVLVPRLPIPTFAAVGNSPRLASKVVLTVMISVGIFAAYMQTRGGIVAHIVSWGGGRRLGLAGDAYWGLLIQLGLIACLTWFAVDRQSASRPLFWGCAGVSLGIIFLFSGSRSGIIYPLFLGLLVWLLRERRIDTTKIVTLMLIGVFLIGFLGEFRRSTFDGEIDWDLLTGESADSSALVTGLDEIAARSSVGDAAFPILAQVPHEVDFLYGQSYLAVLVLPVPRAFWPEKPGLVGGLTGTTFFGGMAGVPPGAIGEAYWNFGVPGVFAVFLIFGAFCRWLATVFQHNIQVPVAIVLYVITLFYFFDPSSPNFVTWLRLLVLSLLFLKISGLMPQGDRPRTVLSR